MRLSARGLTDGTAAGAIVLLGAPLSLWGGLDLDTGCICDRTHPAHGRMLAGEVLAMPAARGSSSSSSALVEAARRGTAPAAILMQVADPILVIGSLVAADLYGVQVPLLLLRAADWSQLADGAQVTIRSLDGRAEICG